MKQYRTLDGFAVTGRLTGTRRKISRLQQKAIDLIREILPVTPLIVEVKLPVNKKNRPKHLYGDILMVKYAVLIEVNGEQHSKPSHHFHRSRYGYDVAKTDEGLKQQWCELNNIALVALQFNEDTETWKKKITNAVLGDKSNSEQNDNIL